MLLGLAKTGRIITAAGIIMAIAFFGLLLSNQASMNQLSFFLVIAVLFDTFIVSTILVRTLLLFKAHTGSLALTITPSIDTGTWSLGRNL